MADLAEVARRIVLCGGDGHNGIELCVRLGPSIDDLAAALSLKIPSTERGWSVPDSRPRPCPCGYLDRGHYKAFAVR